MKEYFKFTNGFVTQKFVRTEDGTGWRCAEQEFTAGDSEYETLDGEPIDPPDDEAYEPFEMVQPTPAPSKSDVVDGLFDEAVEEPKQMAAKQQEQHDDDKDSS